MPHTQEIITLLNEVLHLGPHMTLRAESLLLGSLPELDSMAVINVIGALEERFGISVGDDDISAATFETVASLERFVSQKLVE